MDFSSPEALAVIFGLLLGAIIGAAAFASNLCAVGAIADIMFAKDRRRLRAWMMAGGIAIVGAQSLETAGLINLGSSTYLIPRLSWIALIVGGVAFGFGMSLAGGCINRALVRTGAGSLKSLVTLIVAGLFAAMTTTGVLAPIYNFLSDIGELITLMAPGIDRVFGIFPGVDAVLVRWIFTAFFGGGMIYYCLKDAWFRASKDLLIGSLIIGVCIPAAWLVVGTLSEQSSNVTDYSAINFVIPSGEILNVIMVSGFPAALFGIATFIGVPIGSFFYALATRNLALESFSDPADLPRHLIGGALMGFGGTLAMGCTFGQGLSGLSTLSVGSMIVIGAIWFGCVWGIRYFESNSVWRGFKLALPRRKA